MRDKKRAVRISREKWEEVLEHSKDDRYSVDALIIEANHLCGFCEEYYCRGCPVEDFCKVVMAGIPDPRENFNDELRLKTKRLAKKVLNFLDNFERKEEL